MFNELAVGKGEFVELFVRFLFK